MVFPSRRLTVTGVSARKLNWNPGIQVPVHSGWHWQSKVLTAAVTVTTCSHSNRDSDSEIQRRRRPMTVTVTLKPGRMPRRRLRVRRTAKATAFETRTGRTLSLPPRGAEALAFPGSGGSEGVGFGPPGNPSLSFPKFHRGLGIECPGPGPCRQAVRHGSHTDSDPST